MCSTFLANIDKPDPPDQPNRPDEPDRLMKWCCFVQDTEGREVELRYFRDIDKRKVDFVLLEDSKPIHFIECKLNEMRPSNGLKYLKKRFPQVVATQVVLDSDDDLITKEGIRVCAAHRFLEAFV